MFTQERHHEHRAVHHAVLERRGVRAGGRAALHVAARFGEHDGVDECGLGREAPIEGGAADAAAARDVFHRGPADPDKFGLFERGGQDAPGDRVRVLDVGENRRIWLGEPPDELRCSGGRHVFLLARRRRPPYGSDRSETLIVSMYRTSQALVGQLPGGIVMRVGLWTRWVAMHGVPRAYFAVRSVWNDPLARLLANPGGDDDRYPLMEQIRANGPLMRTPFVWVSVDHDVCRGVLRDKRFGVTPPAQMELPRPVKALIARTDPGVANPVEPPAMVIVDPPDHTRYRQLVAQSFTPRAIETLSSRVVEVTEELLDRIAVSPNPDLIADFAAQLPVTIIAELLDLPVDADSRSRMLEWGHGGSPLLDVGIGWKTYRGAIDDLRGLDDYLAEHFRRLRAGQPRDNPFSRLAADGTLTDRELTANAALIIGAGFETTVNLIGNGIVALLRHPEQLALLREDPNLWPAAVEEILRIDSPVQMTARTARCDVDIAGRRVAGGEMVALLLGGANRDPNVFTDPSRFDITRTNAREHLAFASGVHACLGAALARIEGGIALRALFEAFPDLRLTTPPRRRDLVNLRGFARLPAQLGSRRTTTVDVPA